ncbi:hypothetical protein EW146_g2623 [Bondarzewia mesenterica]|uniref:Uncharacterized protein n=1 Tax=Bondarzewia mesenterica TaxID=1095465 RepID=A0A4S4M675_9AGAM|nr:hypothetical protein EW146_g2623 [Bondarzewia mesenterica]
MSVEQKPPQQQVFNPDYEPLASPPPNVPLALERSTLRLEFPPSYVVVGVYRLVTDKSLYVPIWKKVQAWIFERRRCRAELGCVDIQYPTQIRQAISHEVSPSITGISNETILGFKMPFDIPTYATVMIIVSQLTGILTFFLARNLRIARQRAWDQTVASRGKGPEFWGPYIEEWDVPPVVDDGTWAGMEGVKTWLVGYTIKRVMLFPLHAVPFVGIFIAAFFKSMDTARYLHRPYFQAKKMNRHQIALFVAEHRWDYRVFGFAAALLESIPFLGLLFSVSNRIGAAMWAHGQSISLAPFPNLHPYSKIWAASALIDVVSSSITADLEKRQHYIGEEKAKKAT